MNFPLKIINIIRSCISIVHFSINLNGSAVCYFKNSRRLRQGDPLSPYLFLIVMEGFFELFKRYIKEGGFDFHPKYTRLEISHLSFANNLFILTTAMTNSFNVIKQVLEEFGNISGLKPNPHKSQVFFVGVEDEQTEFLCGILGMPKGTLPVT